MRISDDADLGGGKQQNLQRTVSGLLTAQYLTSGQQISFIVGDNKYVECAESSSGHGILE